VTTPELPDPPGQTPAPPRQASAVPDTTPETPIKTPDRPLQASEALGTTPAPPQRAPRAASTIATPSGQTAEARGGRWSFRGIGRAGLTAWVALGVVYVVWGSTFLGIRVAVRHLPPATMAGARFLLAGALLYPFAVRSGGAALRVADRPTARRWGAAAVVGVLLLGVGNGGVTFAERHLESGTAALLAATIPLWMILLGAAVNRRRPRRLELAGVGVGLAGIVVLTGTPGGATGGGPIALALGAAAGWGFGSVLAERLALPRRATLAAAMELLAGGLALLVVGAIRGEWAQIDLGAVPVSGWLAVAWLVVPGSILAYTAYGYALANLPIGVVSTYAFVNPVVAVLLGALLLGEKLRPAELAGSALIVVAIMITLRARRREGPPG
jgi:drug/metabolite transporter (DMT)-like permease